MSVFLDLSVYLCWSGVSCISRSLSLDFLDRRNVQLLLFYVEFALHNPPPFLSHYSPRGVLKLFISTNSSLSFSIELIFSYLSLSVSQLLCLLLLLLFFYVLSTINANRVGECVNVVEEVWWSESAEQLALFPCWILFLSVRISCKDDVHDDNDLKNILRMFFSQMNLTNPISVSCSPQTSSDISIIAVSVEN